MVKTSLALVGLLWSLLFGVPAVLAQESEPEDEEETKEEGEEEEEEEEPPPLTELEKKVLALFSASSAEFEKGRIVLTYDFETEKEELVEDWQPPIDKTQKRVRWAVAKEGPTVVGKDDDGYRTTISVPGIVIADNGQWLHKATFLPEVEIEVDIYSMAQPRAGTILCPVFYSPKKKMALGAHGGFQLVCVSGAKAAIVRPPYPKTDRQVTRAIKQCIGFKYNGKVFEAYKGGKKTVDSSEVPKFTEGFDSGLVGLAWNGSVQCHIRRITIRGRLDPDWVALNLDETGKTGKGAGTK